MEITVSQKQGRVPVTILHLSGALDGATYKILTEQAKNVYRQGARDLLLDLADLSFLSSTGITSLHEIVLLFRSSTLHSEEEVSFRAIERDCGSGVNQHVKLLNPQLDVLRVLELVGFKAFFEIYTELELAVASF